MYGALDFFNLLFTSARNQLHPDDVQWAHVAGRIQPPNTGHVVSLYAKQFTISDYCSKKSLTA